MNVFEQIQQEVYRAEAKHAPMNSAHEGYAVILEEMRELEAEVFKGGTLKRDWHAMRKEAIEVAAMCCRLIRDVIDKAKVQATQQEYEIYCETHQASHLPGEECPGKAAGEKRPGQS